MEMDSKQTSVGYLRQELNGAGDFVSEYKGLEQKDKDELKRYAREEMDLLGIEHI